MTKEEAITNLKQCGILNENEQINEAYKDILIKTDIKNTNKTKLIEEPIIKAMQCVIGNSVSCSECEYQKALPFPSCRKMCAEQALDLINRKNAKIEELKAEIKRLEKESLDKEKTYNNEYFLRREIEDELKYVRDEYHKENKELKKIIKRQEQLINKIEGGCTNMEEFETNRNFSEEYHQWVVDMCQAYGDGANVLLSAIPLYQLQIGAQLQREAAKERGQQCAQELIRDIKDWSDNK